MSLLICFALGIIVAALAYMPTIFQSMRLISRLETKLYILESRLMVERAKHANLNYRRPLDPLEDGDPWERPEDWWKSDS